MHHDHIPSLIFNAAESVVVKSDLRIARIVGNHQLNRITIPGTVGSIFMIVVSDSEAEIDIVIIINDLHRRGLVIRSCPRSAGILFEENQLAFIS